MRRGGLRVRRRLRFQALAGRSQPLDVIGVRVRRDQHLALGQREIELADQLDHFVECVILPDIDERPFVPAVDQIDIHAERLGCLKIQFNHTGEEIFPGDHFLAPTEVSLS